jgi:hypothetical protein
MVVGKGRGKDIADIVQKHDPGIVTGEVSEIPGLTHGALVVAAVGWS